MRDKDDINKQDEITSLVLSCITLGVSAAACTTMWLYPKDLPHFWWYIVLACAFYSVIMGFRAIRRLL